MRYAILIAITLLSGCSATEENAKAFAQQGYQDARKLRLTSKQECIFHMIGTNASQIEGCFNYVKEFNHKAGNFGDSDLDAFDAAPSADELEYNTESDDENECLVSEGGAEYITECNHYIK